MNSRSLVLTAILLSATPALAEDLEATITPGAAPYPYLILGAGPGMEATSAEKTIEEARDIDLVEETASYQFKSPSGAGLSLQFPTRLVTGSVGATERLSGEPYEEVTVDLATPVMGSRVTGIHRTLRLNASDAPDAKGLLAQLKDEYGTPSGIIADGSGTKFIYAWGDSGFIDDLASEPAQVVEERKGNSVSTRTYETCATRGKSSGYQFSQEEREPFMPGCRARLTIEHAVNAQSTTIRFSLIDYELIRQFRTETDKQVMQRLTGDGGAKDQPSIEF